MVPSGSFSVYRKLAVGVFALALVVVAVLLLTLAGELPATDIWDKLEHAGAFAGLAFLGFLAFPERTSTWWLALGLIGFGSVCEFLQCSFPAGSRLWSDAIANAIGVLLVSGLWRLRHLAGGLNFPPTTTEYEKVMAPRRAPSPMIRMNSAIVILDDRRGRDNVRRSATVRRG